MRECVHEAFLHAAVSGHSDELQYLIELNNIPDELRDQAHRLALLGGHEDAAKVIKPVVH